MRKVYQALYMFFISKTPESFQKLRNFFVGKYIRSAGKNISIGRFSFVHKNTAIGNNSGVGRNCQICDGVTIGNDVMMGPDVIFYSQNHKTDRVDIPMRTQGMTELKPIVIEDDVWIGARVVILSGVTIGKGSVIGAGAVISKSIPPYSVAVGNPIRIVKNRNDNMN